MDALQRWLTLLGLLAAALAALGYVSRQVWRGFKALDRVGAVLLHELTPNSGSSMKDEITSIARAVGQLQADIQDIRASKETAHAVLQVQLDSIVEELGIVPPYPSHRRKL